MNKCPFEKTSFYEAKFLQKRWQYDTVWLASISMVLIWPNKYLKLLLTYHKQSYWIQTSETEGQLCSDTCPYKVSEYSLFRPSVILYTETGCPNEPCTERERERESIKWRLPDFSIAVSISLCLCLQLRCEINSAETIYLSKQMINFFIDNCTDVWIVAMQVQHNFLPYCLR